MLKCMHTVSMFFDNYNIQTGDKLKEKPNYSVKAVLVMHDVSTPYNLPLY